MGQQVRRSLERAGGDRGRPPAQTLAAGEDSRAPTRPRASEPPSASPGPPGAGPPGEPDGGIEHPALRVADHRPAAEPGAVPGGRVAEFAQHGARCRDDAAGTGTSRRCRRDGGRRDWRSRRSAGLRRRSGRSARRPAGAKQARASAISTAQGKAAAPRRAHQASSRSGSSPRSAAHRPGPLSTR